MLPFYLAGSLRIFGSQSCPSICFLVLSSHTPNQVWLLDQNTVWHLRACGSEIQRFICPMFYLGCSRYRPCCACVVQARRPVGNQQSGFPSCLREDDVPGVRKNLGEAYAFWFLFPLNSKCEITALGQ